MPRFRICGLVSCDDVRWGSSLRVELDRPQRPTEPEALNALRRPALLALRSGLGRDAMSLTAEELEAAKVPHEVYLQRIDDEAFVVAARRAAFERGLRDGLAVGGARASTEAALDEQQAEQLGRWAGTLRHTLEHPGAASLRGDHGFADRWHTPEWPAFDVEAVRQALTAFLVAARDPATPLAQTVALGRRALEVVAAAYGVVVG